MAIIKLPNGRKIKAPDGLSQDAYGDIVDEAMAKLEPSSTKPNTVPDAALVQKPDRTTASDVLLAYKTNEANKLNKSIPQNISDLLIETLPGNPITLKKGLEQIGNISDAGQTALLNLLGTHSNKNYVDAPTEALAALAGQREVGGREIAKRLYNRNIPKTLLGKAEEIATDLIIDPLNAISATKIGGNILTQVAKEGLVGDMALTQLLKKAPQTILSATNPEEIARYGENALTTLSKSIPTGSIMAKLVDMPTAEVAKAAITGTKPTILEKIPADIPQGLKEKITNFGTKVAPLVESIDSRLRKFGEAGTKLADKFNLVEQKLGQKIGESEKIVRNSLQGLTDSELENVTDILDLGVKPINSKTEIAAKNLRKITDNVAEEAIAAKIPGFAFRENFFPHTWKPEVAKNIFKDESWLQKKAADLVKSGEYESLPQAVDFLKSEFSKQFRATRFGNIDFKRLEDAPGWSRDPNEAFSKYLRGSYKRLVEAQEYGLGDTELDTLVNKIGNIYGEDAARFAKDAKDTVIQEFKDLSSASKLSGNIRDMHVLTKMGLAQISNAGQSANTAIYTGLGNTLKSVLKYISNPTEAKEFAEDSGALFNKVMEDLSTSKLSNKFLKLTGFEGIENFNRVVASNAGKFHAEKMFGRLLKNQNLNSEAARALQEIGVDPAMALKRGYLSGQDLKNAGFKVAKITQFGSSPQDLPLMWQSPMGKLLIQFKTFAFQHARFMKNYVLKEAARGNIKPLLNTAIAASLFGEGVTDLKYITKGQNPIEARKNKSILDRQLENFFALGGFGIFMDLVKQAGGGTYGALNALAGPTISGLAEGGAGLLKASPVKLGSTGVPTYSPEDADSIPLKRFLTKQIPIVGRSLSREMYPSR